MSKRSFKDIEQAIKNAAEAHEPAFDEGAWKKMEVLLDKENDSKRPFAFWLWRLVPVLIGLGILSYFIFQKNEVKDNRVQITVEKNNDQPEENNNSNTVDVNKNMNEPEEINSTSNNDQIIAKDNDKNVNEPVSLKEIRPATPPINKNLSAQSNPPRGAGEQSAVERLTLKKKAAGQVKAKMNATITTAMPVSDDAYAVEVIQSNTPVDQNNSIEPVKAEEIIVVKINADNADEKEIEKIVDSVIAKSVNEKKSKNRISKLYVIVAVGAEANGVKLFAADKITGRAGLAAGYQLTKNISVQTGFFVSNKKYVAGKDDYKTKPGSYWNIVNIKSIEANCKVYEIPLQVNYNFTSGKKLQIFATAGLSSYIMKKEAYYFYYDRYGTAHQAGASYTGNKSLFSLLRLSAGIEKQISRQFSAFASPGIAVPLSGVGEGEVKLYSTDIMIGLKFSPFRKK